MAGEPQARRSPAGRVILVIVALMALLLLLAIAVPGLLHSSRSSNHRNAYACLKTLGMAEQDFHHHDRDGNTVRDYWVGDVSRLYYLEANGQPLKLIELAVAEADAAPKGSLQQPAPKANYRYAAIVKGESGQPYDRGDGRNPSRFAFCAYPAVYRKNPWYLDEGHGTFWTFILNEANVPWKKDTGGAPVTQWPKDPQAEGWVRAE